MGFDPTTFPVTGEYTARLYYSTKSGRPPQSRTAPPRFRSEHATETSVTEMDAGTAFESVAGAYEAPELPHTLPGNKVVD